MPLRLPCDNPLINRSNVPEHLILEARLFFQVILSNKQIAPSFQLAYQRLPITARMATFSASRPLHYKQKKRRPYILCSRMKTLPSSIILGGRCATAYRFGIYRQATFITLVDLTHTEPTYNSNQTYKCDGL